MSRTLAALLAFLPGLAWAQADVGLVDQLSGEATYFPSSGAGGKVTAYMKVRDGDRVQLKPGARVRIVYFESARQERWLGPAALRVGPREGVALSGAAPTVTQLPPNVPHQLARVPELMRYAKMGGVQVRASPPGASARVSLDEARATYEKLKRQAQGNDISPELYLFAVLSQHEKYEEMAKLASEMRRKQPDNEEVRMLGTWSETVKNR